MHWGIHYVNLLECIPYNYITKLNYHLHIKCNYNQIYYRTFYEIISIMDYKTWMILAFKLKFELILDTIINNSATSRRRRLNWCYIKIILLGIISIVCIARTSGKTDVRLETTMTSWSEASWAWSWWRVLSLESCPPPLKNVPLLLVGSGKEVSHSERFCHFYWN